jgi:hypothetical protein
MDNKKWNKILKLHEKIKSNEKQLKDFKGSKIALKKLVKENEAYKCKLGEDVLDFGIDNVINKIVGVIKNETRN